MNVAHEKIAWPRRFVRWLFGAPFRRLPLPFGDPTPADLRAFREQATEARRHTRGRAEPVTSVHHAHTRPISHDDSLERQ
jgi:hypothetical protein